MFHAQCRVRSLEPFVWLTGFWPFFFFQLPPEVRATFSSTKLFLLSATFHKITLTRICCNCRELPLVSIVLAANIVVLYLCQVVLCAAGYTRTLFLYCNYIALLQFIGSRRPAPHYITSIQVNGEHLSG